MAPGADGSNDGATWDEWANSPAAGGGSAPPESGSGVDWPMRPSRIAATMGRTDDGRLIFPAVALWALVPGVRALDPSRGRARLINFLVATFEEVVYI